MKLLDDLCARLHPGAHVRVVRVEEAWVQVELTSFTYGAGLGWVARDELQREPRPLDTSQAFTGENAYGGAHELVSEATHQADFSAMHKCGFYVRKLEKVEHGKSGETSSWFRVSQVWETGVEVWGYTAEESTTTRIEPVSCLPQYHYDAAEYAALLRDGGEALPTGNEALAKEALAILFREPTYVLEGVGQYEVGCRQVVAVKGKRAGPGICTRGKDDFRVCQSLSLGDSGIWFHDFVQTREGKGPWRDLLIRCSANLNHVVQLDEDVIGFADLANEAGPSPVAAAVSPGAVWVLYRSPAACQQQADVYNRMFDEHGSVAVTPLRPVLGGAMTGC